jgi:hypothetical protein
MKSSKQKQSNDNLLESFQNLSVHSLSLKDQLKLTKQFIREYKDIGDIVTGSHDEINNQIDKINIISEKVTKFLEIVDETVRHETIQEIEVKLRKRKQDFTRVQVLTMLASNLTRHIKKSES